MFINIHLYEFESAINSFTSWHSKLTEYAEKDYTVVLQILHFTVTALLHYLYRLLSIKKVCFNIYLNLKIAFNTILLHQFEKLWVDLNTIQNFWKYTNVKGKDRSGWSSNFINLQQIDEQAVLAAMRNLIVPDARLSNSYTRQTTWAKIALSRPDSRHSWGNTSRKHDPSKRQWKWWRRFWGYHGGALWPRGACVNFLFLGWTLYLETYWEIQSGHATVFWKDASEKRRWKHNGSRLCMTWYVAVSRSYLRLLRVYTDSTW